MEACHFGSEGWLYIRERTRATLLEYGGRSDERRGAIDGRLGSERVEVDGDEADVARAVADRDKSLSFEWGSGEKNNVSKENHSHQPE